MIATSLEINQPLILKLQVTLGVKRPWRQRQIIYSYWLIILCIFDDLSKHVDIELVSTLCTAQKGLQRAVFDLPRSDDGILRLGSHSPDARYSEGSSALDIVDEPAEISQEDNMLLDVAQLHYSNGHSLESERYAPALHSD